MFAELLQDRLPLVSIIDDLSHLLPKEGTCTLFNVNTQIVRVREYADGSGMWEAWNDIEYWACESECPKYFWDASATEDDLVNALSSLEFILKVLHN